MGGNNRGNMRQAMKQLLGLVGFGPEEKSSGQAPAAAAHPTGQSAVEESQVVVERVPKVERPRAEQPAAVQPRAKQPAGQVREEPVVDLETTRQKVAAAVERTFFSLGDRQEK